MNRPVLAVLALLFLSPAQAQNLLTNPDFDQGVEGWDAFSLSAFHGRLVADSQDRSGRPNSGSARMEKTNCCSAPTQLVPIADPDVRYRIRASVQPLVTAEDGGSNAELAFTQYAQDCDALGSVSDLQFLGSGNKPVGEWTDIQVDDIVLLSDTRCVGLALDYREFSGTALYDQMYLGPQPIEPTDSAAYFNPDREGEGIVVLVEDFGSDTLVFLTWYSYENGEQIWLAGNAFTGGQGVVEVPLIRTRGTGFGEAFVAGDVITEQWGQVELSFSDCGVANVVYRENNGQEGALQMVRLTGPIGACQSP